jgi:MSHA biogenesis protein MshJ
MDKLKEWQGKIDNLSLRERGALLFCVLFVVYFIWDMFLMQPLQIREKRANTQLQQKQAEQLALNTQVQALVVDVRTDPDKAGREKLRSLRSQLQEIESQMQDSTQQLISPRNMAVMLENVLRKVQGLELLEVKGLGSEPVIKLTKPTTAGGPAEQVAIETKPVGVIDNAYKHGLRIKFRGDYMSTLAYIQELENMEWGFFWESLKFEVNEYPSSTAVITVFTLSLDENWIGV